MQSIAAYRPSSKWNMQIDGYEDEALADGRYKIVAIGTTVTSMDRLRTMALARAAEVGIENKRAFFRMEQAKEGYTCSGLKVYGQTTVHGGIPRLEIVVSYADAKSTPDAAATRETFARLKGQLDSEPDDADARKTAAETAWRNCKVGSVTTG